MIPLSQQQKKSNIKKKILQKDAIISFRIPHETKQRITVLAESSERSNSFVVNRAIECFLALQDVPLQGIQKGIQELNQGQHVAGDTVLQWMTSLGAENELPRPISETENNKDFA